MTKETLIKILSEKSMPFSEKEIHEMLDAELEKDPAEMDTDFVDLCLDVLDGKYGEGYYVEDDDNDDNNSGSADKDTDTDNGAEDKKDKPNKKKIKFGKALLIAAVITVTLACSITAGAKLVQINASDDTVTYNGDHFSINLNGKDAENTVEDIVQTLTQDGIENVVLPSAILNDEYVIKDYQSSDNNLNFMFESNKSDIYGTVDIIIYDDKFNFSTGQADVNNEYYSAEEINSNGFNILKFESDSLITLIYVVDNDEYTVTLHNCDTEKAMAIAETIGEQK